MKGFSPSLRSITTTALIILLCLITSRTEAFPGCEWCLFKTNCVDRDGKFHGKWKIYLGEGKDKKLIRNGRFKHGKEVGKWTYYYPDGRIYFREKHKRWQNEFFMQRYHENGSLMREGKAIMISTSTGVNYFWFGDWKVYDEKGKYIYTEVYRNGVVIEKKE
jgi:antitoxin component YwqK of YwqJK toxin-antitoxin module